MEAVDLGPDAGAERGVALEELVPPAVGDHVLLEGSAVGLGELDELGADNGTGRHKAAAGTELDPFDDVELHLHGWVRQNSRCRLRSRGRRLGEVSEERNAHDRELSGLVLAAQPSYHER